MAGFRDMGSHEKIIFVLSIGNIIYGIIFLLVGFSANLANLSVPTSSGGQSVQIMIASTAFMALGVVSIVMGALGIRAARDVSKIKPVYYLSMVSLALSVINLASVVMSGEGGLLLYVISACASALMFYAAWSVNKRVNGAA